MEIEPGGGNVFADLGLPDPEERLLKAELSRQIRALIGARGLAQADAQGMVARKPFWRLLASARAVGANGRSSCTR